MRSHYSWKQTDRRLLVLLGQVEATHVIDVIVKQRQAFSAWIEVSIPNYCHRTRTIAMRNGWSCIQRMGSAKQNAGCFPWRSDKGLAGRTRTLWSCFALSVQQLTKASLLAGVGFAFPMNWGRTGRSCHDFSSQPCFALPCSAWSIMSHCDPPPAQTSNSVASILLGFICDHAFACPRIHT